MTDIVRDPYGNPLNRDNLITALRAEVASKNDEFQKYARRMESDMNELGAENARLTARVKALEEALELWNRAVSTDLKATGQELFQGVYANHAKKAWEMTRALLTEAALLPSESGEKKGGE